MASIAVDFGGLCFNRIRPSRAALSCRARSSREPYRCPRRGSGLPRTGAGAPTDCASIEETPLG